MSDYYTREIGVSRKRLVGEAWFWVVIATATVLVIGGVIWAVSISTANVRGQSGAFKQKVSATNRVQKQEMFEQLNADIDGYVSKIAIARAAVAADASEINQTNLTGVQQVCIDAVQQYNAESRKYTSRDWKSTGLPQTRSTEECA